MNLEDVVFYVAIGSSFLFVLQVIISFFIDLDADFDFDASMGVSDFFSFKGGLHFLLGFGWMGVLNGVDSVGKILMAVAIGILFVVVLAYVYRKVYSLAEERTHQDLKELIGTECELTTFYNGSGTVNIDFDGHRSEQPVKGNPELKSGDIVRIIDCKDGILIVENKKSN
ncbi:MAG: NfeD family protein [Paludibacteraceae bacterium]|nr:NfeD family protein [Paludibacteraceae bacterium]MBR4839659.1 NfeD family protein [Paludibacteraceae bacterium]